MQLLVKIFKAIRYIHRGAFREYYKNNFATGGETVLFYGVSLPIIRGERNIYLGKNVKINEFAYLYARNKAKIVIGDHSTLSSHCRLITSQYQIDEWLVEAPFHDKDIHVDKDIIIGNHCWIANNATILAGVCITGTNVIVASGAVVTKSFNESNIVLGGVPAKIIKTL